MKRLILVLIICSFSLLSYGQECKSGDCENGKGVKVYNDGDIIFNGVFKNGDWVNGRAEYKKSGTILEGTFLEKKLNGKNCTIKDKNTTQKGYFKNNNLVEGEETIIKDGVTQYQKGKFNENFQLNGEGIRKITYNKGEQIFKGFFVDGELNDKEGYIKYDNGSEYHGEVKNSLPNGKGKKIHPNKEAFEEGIYIDGILQQGYDLDEEINKNSTTIPLIYEDGMYYIEVDINGTKIKTLFDTGCFGLAIDKGYLHSAEQDGLIFGDTTIVTVDANNNKVAKDFYLLTSVSVAGIPIVLTPIIGQEKGQPSLFGMSLLKRMGSRFILDLKYNRINIIE